MSYLIDKIGFYRTRDGRIAHVKKYNNGRNDMVSVSW